MDHKNTSSQKTKEELINEIKALLNNLGDGDISPSAYDTAWVARIPDKNDPSKPMFPECLEWVKNNQLADGSWGEKDIEYYHDRIICSLSCIIALKTWNESEDQIKKGEEYINGNLENLVKDQCETIGFELVLPSLMKQAKSFELNLPYSNEILIKYTQMREMKLSKFPPNALYAIKNTISHSLEYLEGEEGIDYDKLMIQQEENGSFGNSSAATSFILLHTDNEKALNYLNELNKKFKGGLPGIYPFEIFERAWVLDNIDLVTEESFEEKQRHLEYLHKNWNPTKGVSISNTFPYEDLDDTSMVFKVLEHNGYDLDTKVFGYYKKEDHYVCFPFQLNPSISAYVHFLGALNMLKNKTEETKKIIEHILNFLKTTQTAEGFWPDKWQISPYYTTCHAVIELFRVDPDSEQLAKAINWIINSQKPDGSWGFYPNSTLEETTYALQALMVVNSSADQNIIEKGIEALGNLANNHSALWIDKCLYTPYSVIKSLVISCHILSKKYHVSE